jgi:hypothetical protein
VNIAHREGEGEVISCKVAVRPGTVWRNSFHSRHWNGEMEAFLRTTRVSVGVGI